MSLSPSEHGQKIGSNSVRCTPIIFGDGMKAAPLATTTPSNGSLEIKGKRVDFVQMASGTHVDGKSQKSTLFSSTRVPRMSQFPSFVEFLPEGGIKLV